jgi:hypothetical protein
MLELHKIAGMVTNEGKFFTKEREGQECERKGGALKCFFETTTIQAKPAARGQSVFPRTPK